jgi:hypothetical protein
MSISAFTHNAPGLYGPPAEDPIAERAGELFLDFQQDALKLAEAAEHVTGATSWCDHLPQDVASVMLGHPDDQAARDLRFMADLRQRVTDRLRVMAHEQAESEAVARERDRNDWITERAA